jgi:hypothetical protein
MSRRLSSVYNGGSFLGRTITKFWHKEIPMKSHVSSSLLVLVLLVLVPLVVTPGRLGAQPPAGADAA